MNRSTPGLPVHHQLPEFTETHVHRVSDAIQPSHPLSSTSITSHIQNWVLFLLWLCLFILSEVSSPLISSSILGTYQPGECIFQCPILLPFHTVHGVLKARILKWFSIPFSSNILSDLSTMTRPSWVALHSMAHSFIDLDKAVVHVIRLVSFL